MSMIQQMKQRTTNIMMVPAKDKPESSRKGVIKTMIDDSKLLVNMHIPKPRPTTRSPVYIHRILSNPTANTKKYSRINIY